MKIVQLYTKKDFNKLKKEEMFDLWFRQALTDKQIAKLYGVTKDDVAERRKGLGLGNYITCAMLYVSGPPKFRINAPKIINIKAPKDWDPSKLDTSDDDNTVESENEVNITSESEAESIDNINDSNTENEADIEPIELNINIKDFYTNQASESNESTLAERIQKDVDRILNN